MHLLERQLEFDSLRGCLEAVRHEGRGRCVLVQGEAGIGKTSLLRAFVQALPAGTPVLAGGCEALFTPRPLGPLIDLASHLPPSLEQALNHEPRIHAVAGIGEVRAEADAAIAGPMAGGTARTAKKQSLPAPWGGALQSRKGFRCLRHLRQGLRLKNRPDSMEEGLESEDGRVAGEFSFGGDTGL